MTYQNPDSLARKESVKSLVSTLEIGEEIQTQIQASDKKLCGLFRSVLSRLYPGEFLTTTKKDDGYLWVKRR